MHIKVIYALPELQYQIDLELAAGSTAGMAIEQSGLQRRFPQIDWAQHRIGILGQCVKPEFVLSEGQRVEICRPLASDPKQARRERATRSRRAAAPRR